MIGVPTCPILTSATRERGQSPYLCWKFPLRHRLDARHVMRLACPALISLIALLGAACSSPDRASNFTTSASSPNSTVRPALPTTQGDTSSSKPDPVITAAGDIARFDCLYCGDLATAALIQQIKPTAVLALGDTQYPAGALKDFQTGYAHTWGLFKQKTKPVPGDHDYLTPGAAGYFRYFGRAAKPKGMSYYSYDLGTWHLIALDSNIDRGPGSAQERWLEADLAATRKRCILAYWHFPRFSSRSRRGGDTSVAGFWADLHAAGTDVVLNGHWHLYERFAPQTPAGVSDPRRGIRQFVVGTGGGALHRLPTSRLANSEIISNKTYGVLKMNLHADSYTWQFVAVDGSVKDSGSQACH